MYVDGFYPPQHTADLQGILQYGLFLVACSGTGCFGRTTCSLHFGSRANPCPQVLAFSVHTSCNFYSSSFSTLFTSPGEIQRVESSILFSRSYFDSIVSPRWFQVNIPHTRPLSASSPCLCRCRRDQPSLTDTSHAAFVVVLFCPPSALRYISLPLPADPKGDQLSAVFPRSTLGCFLGRGRAA